MSTAPFALTLVYIIACSRCGMVEIETVRHWSNLQFKIPKKPEGWRILDGQLICQAHSVEVK